MKEKINNKAVEWLKQSDYDIDTALYMFNGKRFFYAVFMCHLSLEKAIKGLYQKKLKEVPPKSHNLVYLLNKMSILPPENIGRFIVKLSEASVITRYPENLEEIEKEYTKSAVEKIIRMSKEVLVWVKNQF